MKEQQKEKLDQFTLNIEFLLISVVQGVALAALGTQATTIFGNLQWQFIPYAIAGFLFILVFWAGAIVHALSFIDWPLDLPHNFLYFLASLVEVIAFSFMEDPLKWFVATFSFFLVAQILYLVDYFLIKKHAETLTTTNKKLYAHVLSEQKNEMYVFVPAGLIFNVLASYLIYAFPQRFLGNNLHVVLVGLQVFFAIIFLWKIIESFKTRSKLISEATLSD